MRARFVGIRSGRTTIALVATIAAATARVGAQGTGTVTGTVVDGRTLQPMSVVQVDIPTLEIGGLTQANGQFLLLNVPAGTHQLRATRIGFRTATVQIDVTAGQTTRIEINLTAEALALDEVVVTGTAGGTRQRALGNAMARVAAADVAEVAPINTMQDLLQGREAGVGFKRVSGNVGTGSPIRIRGYSSLNVGNNPLIYVDGIRVDNETQAGPNLRDGRQVSKLDDINPEDIERIEVIKGPSAATLYGTEASNGVINIITKRGVEGAPQFDLTIKQGATWLPNARDQVGVAYGKDTAGNIISFNIWDQERDAGRQFFTTGHSQGYALSMRGGTERVRYYLATDWDDQTGIVRYNWNKVFNTRANVSVMPHESLQIDMSTGYVNGTTSFMQQKTSWGVWEQAQWSTPEGADTRLRGFLRARPESIEEVEAIRDNSRFIGSLTLNHTPFDWLTHRAVVGLDQAHEENRTLFPRHPTGAQHDFGGLSLGDVVVERPYTRYITFDYAATGTVNLSDLTLRSSVGAQYYSKQFETVISTGKTFPAPAITSLAGAASTTSTEDFVQNKTLGAYVQQEIGYRDRIFITGAIRGDDNSAFGADFDAAVYPKLSGTWVLSEEDFFDVGWVSSLRLRTAWGKAGQQPDVFAAVRLYEPAVGPASQAAVTPDEVGNPELGPEVSTEIETGFDAGLFDDRLLAQVTYYQQDIRDALVSLPVAPSRGFPGSQSVNLGHLKNWGWEVNLNGRVFDSDAFAVDLGANLSHNRNRVEDVGDLPPTNTLREGFPFPAIFDELAVSAEIDPSTGRLINSSIMCDSGTGINGWEQGGPPAPCNSRMEVFYGPLQMPWEMGYNLTFTFFNNLRLHALVEHRIGGYATSSDVAGKHIHFQTSLAANERTNPLFLARADENFGSGMVYNGGFARLREISANYRLPQSLVERSGASRASVSLGARNLAMLWVSQPDIWGEPIHDPEARRTADTSTGSNSNVPPTASFNLTMRVTF
ncbi:MAG: SusC/RagA family TonB-linked outer membrane protein [Gammaproteobacteria bacterium]|nr:SusC/RagA family TonB-linked outer membrane protein [Gammaproteobacteria bacterium]